MTAAIPRYAASAKYRLYATGPADSIVYAVKPYALAVESFDPRVYAIKSYGLAVESFDPRVYAVKVYALAKVI